MAVVKVSQAPTYVTDTDLGKVLVQNQSADPVQIATTSSGFEIDDYEILEPMRSLTMEGGTDVWARAPFAGQGQSIKVFYTVLPESIL